MIEEAVVKILCDDNCPDSMGIADLGCASGPNTLHVISNIIQILHATTRQLNRPMPELRVSLSDLPGNDFNTLFKSLPDFYKKLNTVTGPGSGSGYGNVSCFVSAVPGSFYGRLFGLKSQHFVHSSSSLHWLSQVSLLPCWIFIWIQNFKQLLGCYSLFAFNFNIKGPYIC